MVEPSQAVVSMALGQNTLGLSHTTERPIVLDESTKGVFTIAVTPFLPNGVLDFDSIDRMVDAYVEKDVNGLTILGMMGEAGKLSAKDSLAVVKRVFAGSPVPVVVGVSAPSFAAMTALSNAAPDEGAACVMVALPSGLRSAAQIVSYCHNAAEALGSAPFLFQDFPLATGVIISPDFILKIIQDCPTCVMLKHEDWPGLEKISAPRAASARACGASRSCAAMAGYTCRRKCNGGLTGP